MDGEADQQDSTLILVWLAFAIIAALEWEDGSEQEPAEPIAIVEQIEEEVPVELSPGGVQVVGRQLTVRITGYSYESCSANPCRTRSGTSPAVGTAAVDPRVIPLGSRFIIDDERFRGIIFHALDTGGGVRGNHIDLWFSSTREAIQWGSRTRTITILE